MRLAFMSADYERDLSEVNRLRFDSAAASNPPLANVSGIIYRIAVHSC